MFNQDWDSVYDIRETGNIADTLSLLNSFTYRWILDLRYIFQMSRNRLCKIVFT